MIFPWLLLATAASFCSGCHWGRKFIYGYSKPLSIKCHQVRKTFIAPPGKGYVVVRWSRPRARGASGRIEEIGKTSGSSFTEGSHRITYIARNRFNEKATCHISFDVKVSRCPVIPEPSNGKISCTGNKYGDVCTFSCQKGFAMMGLSRIKCLPSRRWNRRRPACMAKTCGYLKTVPNSLPFKCDRGRNYGSICLLQCDRKKGYTATKGHVTRCTEKGRWTDENLECKDTEAPRFVNCPSQTIHQSADPRNNLTSVVWPKIKVKDNSRRTGKLRTMPGVTAVGGKFPAGNHIVKFHVQDKAGNEAEPCSFVVQVERKECAPPQLDDKYLKTPGCVPPFTEGSQCKVECSMDIPLEGSHYITCRTSADGQSEAYWDWGQKNDPPKHKPFCQVPKCRNLTAPTHGAMACDKWLGGQMCQVMCQKGYDVPGDYEKYYICPINSGKWNNENIPPCQTAVPGWGQTLPAAYIYSGPCSAVKDEVKTNFIKMLTSEQICSSQYCTVDNVKVTCGGERRKRDLEQIFDRVRRGTAVNFIVFELTIKSSTSNLISPDMIATSTVETLMVMMNSIKKTDGFTVSGMKIHPITVRNKTPVPVCSEGHVRGRHSKTSCVPCPVGSFYSSSKQCQSCQQGSYQDRAGSLACVSCQDGFTTVKEGASNKTDCVEMCHPGTYSPTGISPCTACPPGTYQPHEGGTSCKPCPRGMRTKGSGAKFLLECIPFDVLFQGPVSVAMSSASHANVCEFTLSVWVKVIASKKKGLTLEVYHPQHGTQISVELGPSIKIAVARDLIHLKKGLHRKWSHVAIVWSRRSVHVFIDGTRVYHKNRSCTRCPIPGQASMTIRLAKNAYALVQSLNVIPSANASAIPMLSKSCEAVLDKTLFSVNGLNISSLDRVLEVTPSTCLQNDACQSKPCEDHHCVPTNGTFRCVCKGGYSGDKCQEKPDFCQENQCAYGSTCQSNMIDGYQCLCPANVTGMLCEENAATPEWSEWSDWGECSKTCGTGFKVRRRFCSSGRKGRKLCSGKDTQSNVCKLATCPDCNQTDLIAGRGVSVACTKLDHNITCSIKCQRGLVYSEEPVNYTCAQGEWTPDRHTQSCTVPHSPYTVGIKYSVLLHTELSVTDAQQNLLHIGTSFGCVRARTCRQRVDIKNCDATTAMCKKYGGEKVGHLNLFKDVHPGSLNLSDVLQNHTEDTYSPLLKTWQVLRHESTETSSTPDNGDRPLQLQVQGSESLIFPRDNRSMAVRVGGEFGRLLSAWHELDVANWEVRKNNYSAFNFRFPDRKAPYMVAEQQVTCPEGAVPGGLFCMKCAPGTYYSKKVCLSCPTGFYQDETGQTQCKPCPGFSANSLVGASSVVSCRATERSNQYLLLTTGRNMLTKVHVSSMRQETRAIPIQRGSISLHVYNPTDHFIYYTTQSPATIGRVKWDGTQHKVMMTLNADEITGLAVDERSNVIFFTLYSGSLRALTPDLDTDILILDDLKKPRDLVIDQQKFTMYWSEGTRIMKYSFGARDRTTVLSRDAAIWGLRLEEEANSLWWFARGKLYSTDTEITRVETSVPDASVFHGRIDDYHFYIDNENGLMRVNRDGVTKTRLLTFKTPPKSVSVTSNQEGQWRHMLCKRGRQTCEEACWQIGQLETVCLCSRHNKTQEHGSSARCWSP